MAVKVSILKSFDMDSLKAARAKAMNKTDLVAALKEISPSIEKLHPGQTARLEIPEEYRFANANDKGNTQKLTRRSFLMSIRAKLNNITPKGKPWAGRTFAVGMDPENNFVYIQRGNDETPVEAAPRGRAAKPKASTPAQEGSEKPAESENTDQVSDEAKVLETA